jgi:hypothetical protein
VLEFLVRGKGLQEPGSERGEDALEEFEKDEAGRVTFRQESITLGVREFLDQALGAELPQMVTQGGEAVVLGGADQSRSGLWVQFGGRKGARGDV